MKLPNDDGDYLPYKQVRSAFNQFREYWKTLPETQEQIAQIARRCETQDKRARTLRSNFRTWCFEKMGGEIWLQIFLAWKTVSSSAVEKVNAHIKKTIRIKTKKDASAASRGPILSRRGVAKAANRRLPAKTGVNHKRSPAYFLRKFARTLTKKLNEADQNHRAGRINMRMYQSIYNEWKAIGSGWRRPKDFPELRRVLTQFALLPVFFAMLLVFFAMPPVVFAMLPVFFVMLPVFFAMLSVFFAILPAVFAMLPVFLDMLRVFFAMLPVFFAMLPVVFAILPVFFAT